MSMKKNAQIENDLEFSPDFFCTATWIRRCSILFLSLMLIMVVLCFIVKEIQLTDFMGIVFFILLLAFLFAFIIIMGSRSNAKLPDNLRYVISDSGIDIMVKKKHSVMHIPWKNIADVVVLNGPQEFNLRVLDPLAELLYSGPYGVYLVTRTDLSWGTTIDRKDVLNLFLPNSLKEPNKYSAIHLCTKISRKKCEQVRKMIYAKRTSGLGNGALDG